MNQQPGKPGWWDTAAAELSAADPRVARLISKYKHEVLTPSGNVYQALVNAIIGQQISVKAASSIRGRVLQLCPNFEADLLLAADEEALRACGLSRQKIVYLRGIAEAERGRELEFEENHPEQDLLQRLTALKGVGEWTAQMVMIFALGKPDVLPLADIGILNAVALSFDMDPASPRRELAARVADVGQAWRPWRTLASWYLWRSLDPEPVVY